MSNSPTLSATSSTWSERSFSAALIKFLAFVVPLFASVAWTIVLVDLLHPPATFLGEVVWWTVIAGGAIAIALCVERLGRRLLPMAMLLRLSLVFPEVAPSRFSMALRANSARQLRRRVAERVIDEDSTPQEAAISLLELCAAMNVHDRKTRGHAERVRAYSVMIGEQIGLTADELNKLQWSALLHDVGKLDVSTDILNKPGAPTDEEFESLRAHPDRSREYIAPLVSWLGEWAGAAWQHHERFDGTGYPSQLAGEEISLAARIVSVADAYDVMTSTRSYKAAMDAPSARAELLNCSGSQFDPELVRAFLSVPVSELRRPFQAALGASALASLTQLADPRTIATSVSAVAAAAVLNTTMSAGPPAVIAFAESTPNVVEVQEDSEVEIPLRTTIEAFSYTIDSVDGPAIATIEQGLLHIEPANEESGTVTVSLTACSGDSCDSTVVVAEVIAVNDAPTAFADEATTSALRSSISIPVLDNDTDVDSRSLSITSGEVVQGDGSVEISTNGQELLFTHAPGSGGPWSIEYVVTDGRDGFDRGTVTIVDGDVAPKANDDVTSVAVGEAIEIDVRANDDDDGGVDRLTIIDVQIVSPADTTAQVSVAPNGTLNFVAGSTAESVEVNYTIQDRMMRQSTATVEIEVTPPAPVAVDDEAMTEQDSPVTVAVLANDGPASLDLATADVRVISQSEGAVEVSDVGDITYTPPANAVGKASIVYELCSGPAACDTATVLVTVTPAVEQATRRSEGSVAVSNEAGLQRLPWSVVSSGQGPLTQGTTFSIRTDSPGLFATPPTISSQGMLSFEPKRGASGNARITITASDVTGERDYRLNFEIS